MALDDALWDDLKFYFTHATKDQESNKALARGYKTKWGDLFVKMAPAFVGSIIEGSPKFLPGLDVVASGMQGISIAEDLLRAWGPPGPSAMLSAVEESSDEDSQALEAYLIASNNFANPASLPVLYRVYPRIIGSSCKLTVAFAQHKCGDSRKLMDLFLEGYLCPAFLAKGHLDKSLEDSHEPKETVERRILDWYSINGMPNVLGVFPILVLDIWSKGGFAQDGYLAELEWKRKTYNE